MPVNSMLKVTRNQPLGLETELAFCRVGVGAPARITTFISLSGLFSLFRLFGLFSLFGLSGRLVCSVYSVCLVCGTGGTSETSEMLTSMAFIAFIACSVWLIAYRVCCAYLVDYVCYVVCPRFKCGRLSLVLR